MSKARPRSHLFSSPDPYQSGKSLTSICRIRGLGLDTMGKLPNRKSCLQVGHTGWEVVSSLSLAVFELKLDHRLLGGGGWRGAHQRGGSRLRSGWLLAPSSSGGARVSGSSEQSAGVLPGISRPPKFSPDPSVWEMEGDTLRGEVSPGMEVDSSWAGPRCRKSLLSRTCWKWRHSGRWWAVRCLLPFPGLAKHLEGSVHS